MIMDCYPTTRVIFDRKKEATRTKAALAQVEVTYRRKRTYVSTGVKVFADQWNDRLHVVRRLDSTALNERIGKIKDAIDIYINGQIDAGREFDFAAFSAWRKAAEEKSVPFVEWVEQRIATRSDITDGSRRTQMKLVGVLRDFGLILDYKDFTRANVMKFDKWLHAKGLRQSTVWCYHKTLKTYIREAIRLELADKDPYTTMKIDKGRGEWGRFLSVEELRRLEDATMPTDSLSRVRDLFVVQCHTGLAYSDLMRADFSKAREVDGLMVLTGERKKTTIGFTTIVTPKVAEILARYGGTLPKMSNVQYNLRLKVVADAAGIDKPLASHWGRRTCGMMLLNEGFPIEVVAKVLGHADIKTTQQAYAKILDETVVREFAKRMG